MAVPIVVQGVPKIVVQVRDLERPVFAERPGVQNLKILVLQRKGGIYIVQLKHGLSCVQYVTHLDGPQHLGSHAHNIFESFGTMAMLELGRQQGHGPGSLLFAEISMIDEVL